MRKEQTCKSTSGLQLPTRASSEEALDLWEASTRPKHTFKKQHWPLTATSQHQDRTCMSSSRTDTHLLNIYKVLVKVER